MDFMGKCGQKVVGNCVFKIIKFEKIMTIAKLYVNTSEKYRIKPDAH